MSDVTSRLSSALAKRYRIERKLGEGGMATVYLAEDLKHKRKVAVKVLRPELAAVLGAERFVQEITTTANLQHPHILPLFDSGEADGFLYYVMPFIDGETLRDKLNRETQLGIEEAVSITTDVADALDYAHRQNVIHRDIKPENILLHEGRPVVADFGIALAVSAAAGGRMTETGLSLGTPHYMSPEQATAEKDLTNRSDIYSLGSVLYEMLTGSPPHVGSSAQQIIMKIVAEDVQPVTELRKSVPAHVAAATAKSLEKLPADRFTNAAKFAEALTGSRVMSEATIASYAPPTSEPPVAVAWRTLWKQIVLLVVVSGAVGWLIRPGPSPETRLVTRFTIPVPQGHVMLEFASNLAISPDGRTLAYFVDGVLHKRELGRDGPERFDDAEEGCCPFFSSDGKWIIFSDARGDARRIAVDGGPVVDAPMRFLSAESFIKDRYRGGLERATDDGWVPITIPDSIGGERAHMWPQLLPGGDLLLFTVLGPSMMWHNAQVVVEELASGSRTTIANGATFGRYVPTGHIVYTDANGTLEAVPFDLKARRVTGDPMVVESGVRAAYWGGAASFAIAEGGTFAFVRGSSWGDHLLTWIDRRGKIIEQIGKPVTVEVLDLSPDDRHVVTYGASNNADISRFDAVTGDAVRLTFDPTTEDNPIWSPDGRRIAYRKIHSGTENRIEILDVVGQTDPQPVFSDDEVFVPRSWSPDGVWLLLEDSFGDSIVVLDLDNKDVVTIPRGQQGQFSPDGRWVAYTSSETGNAEVYVLSFPGLQGRQQVSVNGGRWPRWSAQSGELFFRQGDTIMVSKVSTGNAFVLEDLPRPLFVASGSGEGGYDVSADGQRFLVAAQNPDAPAREIHVVLNWFEELKAKVGN